IDRHDLTAHPVEQSARKRENHTRNFIRIDEMLLAHEASRELREFFSESFLERERPHVTSANDVDAYALVLETIAEIAAQRFHYCFAGGHEIVSTRIPIDSRGGYTDHVPRILAERFVQAHRVLIHGPGTVFDTAEQIFR